MSELMERVEKALDSIRPALMADGGNVDSRAKGRFGGNHQ